LVDLAIEVEHQALLFLIERQIGLKSNMLAVWDRCKSRRSRVLP